MLNKNQFTKKYVSILSKKHPSITFKTIEPLVIKATYREDKEVSHYLDNAYREYMLEPKEISEIIERYTDVSTSVYNKNKDIDIDRIVPIIKPSNYFQQFITYENLVENYKTPGLIWESYNEDLIIVYAEDREKNIHYFNQDEFEKLKISRKTLLEFSINNLITIIPKIERVGQSGYYGLIAGGDYEASLLLMTDIWTKENFDVDGEIVIAIPNRDIIFITGSNNKESIEQLKVRVQESYETGNHSISTSIYKWNGKKFKIL